MSSPTFSLRGIALMLAATASYVSSDTFMKMATEDLPPFEVLLLRGIAAAVWCVPLVALTRTGGKVRMIADRWVLARNLIELVAVLFFIVALANVPIADITAIGQTAPLFLIVGAALFLGERLTVSHGVLILAGFAGALMIAQPGGQGFSTFALLGFVTAVGMAARDIVGRRIDDAVPGPIVALSAVLVVVVGSGIAMLAAEEWHAPSVANLVHSAFSGFFLVFGHLFLFLSYRAAPVRVIAPFIYMFTVWALVSGVVVFGDVPNMVAFAGIALIVASGVAIALIDRRARRRLAAPVA